MRIEIEKNVQILLKKLKNSVWLVLTILALTIFAQAQTPVSFSINAKPEKIKPGGKLTAQISASIGGGWHVYSITQPAGGPVPTRLSIGEGIFKEAGAAIGSAPHREMDANFGIVTETYTGSASFSIPLVVDSAAQPGTQELIISVRYQACNDKVCLPPKTIKISAPVEIVVATAKTETIKPSASPSPAASLAANSNAVLASNINKNANFNVAADAKTGTNDNRAATNEAETRVDNQSLVVGTIENSDTKIDKTNGSETAPATNLNGGVDTNQPLWSFIWLAMTVGALSLLTPCVFPMIPITVSYFTNHAAGSRGGAIRDAIIFTLGIILTFTLLGIALAVLFGAAGINKFAASPYINLIIFGIFISFAVSLFGAFNIGVPTSVLTKLDAFQRAKETGGTDSGAGHFIALLLMGLTFSLTSFTCTAPFVGTLLVTAAQGDWFLPAIGMLAFSSIFALPFFVLALAPQLVSQLPKSGGWLNSVKVVMGLLEIAAAMKFLSNVDLIWGWGIFTREIVLASWIAITLLIGLYILGKIRLAHDSPVTNLSAGRLLASIVFLSLGFYFLTGLFGARLGEIESFLPPATANSLTAIKAERSRGENSGELMWITNDLDAALVQAKRENKSIFIDFTGYTCTNCRWMEANMFTKDAVKQELNEYVRLRLFTDGEGEPFESFQRLQQDRFGTIALPFYAILDQNGNAQTTFAGLTRQQSKFVSFLQKKTSTDVARNEQK